MKKITCALALLLITSCSSMTHEKATAESSSKPIWFKDAIYYKGSIVANITQDDVGMFDKQTLNQKLSQTPFWVKPAIDRFPASVNNAPKNDKIDLSAKSVLIGVASMLPQKTGPESYIDEVYTIKGKSGTELKLVKIRVPNSINEKNEIVYSRYISIFNEKTNEVQKVEYCKNCNPLTMDSFAMDGKWERALEPFLAKL